MEGYFHSFESLAAVDGKGLRCAVFLSGCPLRCAYCHNPDTWTRGHKTIDSLSLTKKITRFKPYFGENGGATFSGGEPLLQAPFLLEMANFLEEEGISYILDTSGAAELTPEVKEVIARSESVLLDLKFWDDASYRKYTCFSIENTLKTLSFLNEIGKNTVIRTVVIPGINDTEECLSLYLEHIKNSHFVSDYELLPFHTMGFFKYDSLGITNPFNDKKPMLNEVLLPLQNFVRERLKEIV